MLVPVSFVGGVTVPIVDVIDVVTVRDSHMPTALSMGVVMVGVLHMRQFALVIVIVVGAMGVAIVDVIDMSLVLHSRMSALGSVLMGVIFMHAVVTRTHGSPYAVFWVKALNPDQSTVLHKPFWLSESFQPPLSRQVWQLRP
jgi:phosphotransferase system  glucose/maltose/N-acetylglucosamine-specific IIC component